MALLTNTEHDLNDVASVGLAILAIRIIKVKSSKNFTYGYKKFAILVALANDVILFY